MCGLVWLGVFFGLWCADPALGLAVCEPEFKVECVAVFDCDHCSLSLLVLGDVDGVLRVLIRCSSFLSVSRQLAMFA